MLKPFVDDVEEWIPTWNGLRWSFYYNGRHIKCSPHEYWFLSQKPVIPSPYSTHDQKEKILDAFFHISSLFSNQKKYVSIGKVACFTTRMCVISHCGKLLLIRTFLNFKSSIFQHSLIYITWVWFYFEPCFGKFVVNLRLILGKLKVLVNFESIFKSL